MHRTSPRPRHVAALAAATLLLAACGGATDDDGAAAPATTAPADDAAAPADGDGDPATGDGEDDTAGSAGDDGEDTAGNDGDDTAASGGDDTAASGGDDTAGSAGGDAAGGADDAGGEDDAGADGGDVAADPLLAITATAPDGSTFTIGDVAGPPVLVETFATWCSNCRRQLTDTQVAAEQAGDDVVVLALSVETSLDPAALRAYAADNGFDDIRFGVLDEEGLVALEGRFGGSVLNPPATPKFRVDPDGTVSGLTTGFETPEEILASLGA